MAKLRDNILTIAVLAVCACVIADTAYHIVTGR